MNRGADFEHGWLELAMIAELPPRQADVLVRRFGSPAAVLCAGGDELVAAGVSTKVAEAIRGAGGRVAGELRAVAALGGRIIPRSGDEYPALLRQIPDPPLALTVRGDVTGPCVAIVGARRASEYGRRVAFEIARDLARAGLTVVSGLAAGVDAAAHRGALDAGGRTVAVLGTGIDVVYPSWHAELARAVAAQGALVTEFPCGTPPLAFHFPRRNRVISGLALGTVVVEATEDSGSLLTAQHANEQGRALFAVPGRLGVAVLATGCLVGMSIGVPEASAAPTRLEAESATISQGTVDADHTGFSGTGFVNTVNTVGPYVEWTINATQSGTATLTFGFANGTTANRPLDITLNGVLVRDELAFNGTGAWTNYSATSVTVTLQQGENKVRATATTANGAANLDYLDIT